MRSASELAADVSGWRSGTGPAHRQLADAIRSLVAAGVLRDGERLPSDRDLAGELQVARGTVVRAYGALVDDGHLVRRQGSGTRVRAAPAIGAVDTGLTSRLLARHPRAVDLRVARPELLTSVADLLDTGLLRRYGRGVLDSHDPAGLPALRERIADRMTRDGLPTSPHEVLVTNGAQHALTLLALHLVRPGDVVLHEATNWPGLADVVGRLGGRSHGIEVGARGVDLDQLARAVDRLRPACIVLNPHHHNPTSTRMPAGRRDALVRIATETGVPLVEDRVLADLAFDHIVPPPLAAHETARAHPHLHVTVDALTKTAWTGLRVGWLRASPATVDALRDLRSVTDALPAVQPQLGALAVLDHWTGILEERITQLRARAEQARDMLAAAVPGAALDRPQGGIAIWGRLPRGTGRDFARHAARHGVLVPCAADFGAPDRDPHLRVAFTAAPAVLAEGTRRLAAAWRSYDPDAPAPAGPSARPLV